MLVMISSMTLPICNGFHAKQANRKKNNHLLRRYPSLTPMCANLVECRRSGLGLLIAKINIQWQKFYAHVVLVYLQSFQHNSHLKCVSQPKIAKKNH